MYMILTLPKISDNSSQSRTIQKNIKNKHLGYFRAIMLQKISVLLFKKHVSEYLKVPSITVSLSVGSVYI